MFSIPLLSELPSRWHAASRSSGWAFAIAVSFWMAALVVVLLGHAARGNALRLQLHAFMLLDYETVQLEVAPQVHGYMAELNHGLFYLTLAPLFVYLALRFAHLAGQAFEGLAQQDALRDGPRVLDRIRNLNRRVFRIFAVIALVALMLFNFNREIRSYFSARAGRSNQVGYVQAPFLSAWGERFDSLENEVARVKRIAPLKTMRRSLEAAVTKEIADVTDKERLQALRDSWGPHVRLHGRESPGWDSTAARLTSGQFSVDLAGAAAESPPLIRLAATTSGGPVTREQRRLFPVFAVTAVAFEAFFHAIAAWTAMKILFWLWLLTWMMPRSERPAGKPPDPPPLLSGNIRPFWEDPRKRYGLSPLYPAYNHIVMLLLIGAIVFSFIAISQSAKGNFMFGGAGNNVAGQLVILVGIVATGIAVILGPWLFFNHWLRRLAERPIGELTELIRACEGNYKRRTSLEQRIELIEQQTTWPMHDRVFRRIILSAAGILLLPIVVSAPFVPADVRQLFDALSALESGIHKACQNLYRLGG